MSTLFYTISLFVHNVRRSQQSLLKMQNISYRAILFCMSGSICSIKAYAWWCWWRSSRCFESGQDSTDTKHHEVIRSKFVIFLSACKSIYERSWSLMYFDVFWCILMYFFDEIKLACKSDREFRAVELCELLPDAHSVSNS